MEVGEKKKDSKMDGELRSLRVPERCLVLALTTWILVVVVVDRKRKTSCSLDFQTVTVRRMLSVG